jgi:hypothetical protein
MLYESKLYRKDVMTKEPRKTTLYTLSLFLHPHHWIGLRLPLTRGGC